MKHSFATEAISERDAAWFEELAEVVERGRAALLARQKPDGCWAGTQPVCDTAVSHIAVTDAGTPSEAAVQWLLAEEARREGSYLGADTTAVVLIALARSGNAPRSRCAAAIHRAINELLAVQNRDGGWAAFDRNAKADPSCPAITARVLEALSHFGFRIGQPPVDAAIDFILARQDDTGVWVNCQGAEGLRTTWHVLAGLPAAGCDVFSLPLRRAVRWLKESQNEDGGWGESTASETAWAVLALLVANEDECAEVRAGAEFLVGTQQASGAWAADAFSETACFPLMALARYLSERTQPEASRRALTRVDAGHRVSGPKSYRHTLAEM